MAESTPQKVARLFLVLDMLDHEACSEILFYLCGKLDSDEQFAAGLEQILRDKYPGEYRQVQRNTGGKL